MNCFWDVGEHLAWKSKDTHLLPLYRDCLNFPSEGGIHLSPPSSHDLAVGAELQGNGLLHQTIEEFQMSGHYEW
jgi:hypothetical protein